MGKNRVTRRDFLKKTGTGATGAAALVSFSQEQARAADPDRAALVASMGDTLIPTDPGDPGYRTLEPYNITAEVLKQLQVSDEDLAEFDAGARSKYGKGFAELAEPHLSPDMEFGVSGYAEPSLVFYLRKHVRGFMSYVKPEQVEEYMAQPGRRFVIVPTDSVDKIGAEARAAWTRLTMDGFNVGRASSVALTMYLKKDP